MKKFKYTIPFFLSLCTAYSASSITIFLKQFLRDSYTSDGFLKNDIEEALERSKEEEMLFREYGISNIILPSELSQSDSTDSNMSDEEFERNNLELKQRYQAFVKKYCTHQHDDVSEALATNTSPKFDIDDLRLLESIPSIEEVDDPQLLQASKESKKTKAEEDRKEEEDREWDEIINSLPCNSKSDDKESDERKRTSPVIFDFLDENPSFQDTDEYKKWLNHSTDLYKKYVDQWKKCEKCQEIAGWCSECESRRQVYYDHLETEPIDPEREDRLERLAQEVDRCCPEEYKVPGRKESFLDKLMK